METKTDSELISELSNRHDELIVIRPHKTNTEAEQGKLSIFCKAGGVPGGYDLNAAIELLHEASVGLIRDSIVKSR